MFVASSVAVRSAPGIKGWLVGVIVAVALLLCCFVLVLALIYRRHLNRRFTIKEEKMRVLFRQESLPQSPVLLHSMTVNSPRSSSGSFTGDKLLRGKIASYRDGFAHVTLPLDRKWEINREHLRIEGELGVGAFGRVLQAAAVGVPGLKAKHTVAIKTLKGKLCATTDRLTDGPTDRPTDRRTTDGRTTDGLTDRVD